MNRFLTILSAAALAGCSTTTPVSQNVVLVSEQAAVERCASLGQIQAQSWWGGVAATGIAYNDALASMKNQTAERGGTHLLMINSSNTLGGTNMIGDAYRC